jgi:signal transduction histidine kinase/CheY-like chemotaxis protein
MTDRRLTTQETENLLDSLLDGDFSALSQFGDLTPGTLEHKVWRLGTELQQQRRQSRARERGMQSIIDAMMRVASGDFEIQIEFELEDDFLEALMLGLNMMAEELAALSTEFIKARDAALAASATKSAFLASMSHELRTPLNAIIGYAELIQEDAELDGEEQLAEDTNKILTASRHLVSLINDILDLSKIEAGKIELAPETFVVEELCQSLTATIAPLAINKSNNLEVEIEPLIGTIHSDRTRLRQILLNLLSNANKFTNEGVVRFVVWQDKIREQICFTVEDSGIGIDKARQAAIFEPFVQEDNTTTRRFGGTGLGLAISKHLAGMLGGDIDLQSEPGKGSSFTLRVAADVRNIEEKGLHEGSSAAIVTEEHITLEGRKDVLVIDDDPHVHALMQRSILAQQTNLISVMSGAEALEYIEEEGPPDLIFLDIELPDTDGWTILAKLRNAPETKDIPVVVISVVDNSMLGFALGATDYLVKPLDYSRLLPLTLNLCGASTNGSVLIVDDDSSARELARRALEPSGFDVLEAPDGFAALRLLEVHRPDAIVLDLMMPGLDGFQVHEKLQDNPELSSIPVVVFSAMDLDSKDRSRLQDRDIVRKDHGYGVLFDVISRAVRLSHEHGQEILPT